MEYTPCLETLCGDLTDRLRPSSHCQWPIQQIHNSTGQRSIRAHPRLSEHEKNNSSLQTGVNAANKGKFCEGEGSCEPLPPPSLKASPPDICQNCDTGPPPLEANGQRSDPWSPRCHTPLHSPGTLIEHCPHCG